MVNWWWPAGRGVEAGLIVGADFPGAQAPCGGMTIYRNGVRIASCDFIMLRVTSWTLLGAVWAVITYRKGEQLCGGF